MDILPFWAFFPALCFLLLKDVYHSKRLACKPKKKMVISKI